MKSLIQYYKYTPGQDSNLGFWCLGCKHVHVIPFINAPASMPGLWAYDGNRESPTITPSLRVMTLDGKESACHVVVTAGVLNYQADCKHALAGKSVPMVPFPYPQDDT